jgi:hypothetical protein
MRLPRVRFTLREMMIAVAITAAVLGFVLERRTRFRSLSNEFLKKRGELGLSDLEMHLYFLPAQGDPNEHHDRERASHPIIEYARYHDQMTDKYKLAASQPWLPVESDPPPPSLDRESVRRIINCFTR